MANLRLAIRTLLKSPSVTIVAVLSLALGIGANAAIFSLFNQMLLKKLPVEAPEELVNLANPGPKPGSQSCGNQGSCDEVFSYPMFRDLESPAGVCRPRGACRLARISRTWSDHQRRRHDGVWQLLSGARIAASARTVVDARGRSHHRRPSRRRVERRVLAVAVRREPTCAERDARCQRPDSPSSGGAA